MLLIRHVGLLLSILTYTTGLAQVGGKHVFKFLDLPSSPRVTALGGNMISLSDEDVALTWHNPAVINSQMEGNISFNYNFHLAGIKSGYLGYVDSLKLIKSHVAFGLNFARYGDFPQTDEFGNITGEFNANEYAFQVGINREFLPNVFLGANLKLITSRLESYNSFGMAADLGFFYNQPEKLRSWGFLLRNIGAQFTAYHQGPLERIPFDIQLGLSKKLEHIPFRFSFIAHHLHRWNLLFDIPGSDVDNVIIGFEEPETSRFGMIVDNLFRHLIFNGEFLLGKNDNLSIRLGYNHQRAKELAVIPYRSLAGFSGGVAFKVKSFQLSYGFGVQHIAGSNNHIGIATSIADLLSNKKVSF